MVSTNGVQSDTCNQLYKEAAEPDEDVSTNGVQSDTCNMHQLATAPIGDDPVSTNGVQSDTCNPESSGQARIF